MSGSTAAQLVAHERHERDARGDGEGDDQRRAPPEAGALDDRRGQARQHDDDEHLADRIGTTRARRARLRHEARRERDRGQADGDVHQEHGPPAQPDEDAAEDGPERHADADDGAPDPDRLRPLARILEGVADDRHRHRVEHRAGGALKHAEGDQPADPRREAAGQRRGGEQREAELEHAGAAEAIRGRAAQHEQAREHHRVGGGRPLQRRDRRAEVAPDRRQRDVDDRHVHPHDQQAHAADREHEPRPRARHRVGRAGLRGSDSHITIIAI